jgi:hypothetical protein
MSAGKILPSSNPKVISIDRNRTSAPRKISPADEKAYARHYSETLALLEILRGKLGHRICSEIESERAAAKQALARLD